MENKRYLSEENASPGEKLLRRRELRALIPVSDMTIYRWERDGQFPRHISVNSRNYWLLSEVLTWISAQARGDPTRRRTTDHRQTDGLGS